MQARPLGLHRGRKRGKEEEEEPSSWEDRGVERTVGIGSSPCWGGPCSAAQCRWAGSVAPHAAKCSGRGVTAMGPSLTITNLERIAQAFLNLVHNGLGEQLG